MYTDGTSADTRLTVIQDDLGRTFVVPPEDGTGGDLIGATGSSERGPCGPFVVAANLRGREIAGEGISRVEQPSRRA